MTVGALRTRFGEPGAASGSSGYGAGLQMVGTGYTAAICHEAH